MIIKPDRNADADPLLEELRRVFLPNRILTVVAEGADQEKQGKVIPLVLRKTAQEGEVTAYVCEDRVCALPTSDPEVFARQISPSATPDSGPPGS